MSAPPPPASRPSPEEQQQEKERIRQVADLMQKGAILLREPCPRCESLQLRYKGKVICTKEDDLFDIPSVDASTAQSRGPPSQERVKESGVTKLTRISSPEDSSESFDDFSLVTVLRNRLRDAVATLSEEPSIERQEKLLNLIIKYLEALERLR
jgi:uncharacterized Zn finger protein (UPF0148 family)